MLEFSATSKGRPFNVWHQGAVRNPATLALAHLLLDSEALNRAAGSASSPIALPRTSRRSMPCGIDRDFVAEQENE